MHILFEDKFALYIRSHLEFLSLLGCPFDSFSYYVIFHQINVIKMYHLLKPEFFNQFLKAIILWYYFYLLSLENILSF